MLNVPLPTMPVIGFSFAALVALPSCQKNGSDRQTFDEMGDLESIGVQQNLYGLHSRPTSVVHRPDSLPVTSGNYGWGVAIEGDRGIVGARSNHGSAYIVVRAGAEWTREAELLASDGAVSDHFGFAVDIAGDLALVGAPDADWGGLRNPGAAYLFERTGSTWSEVAKLTDVLTPNAYLGTSVALAPDAAVAGVPDLSSVTVFARSGSTWQVQQRLTGSDSGFRRFGSALGVFANRMLVGAPASSTSSSTVGKAYLFERAPNGVWQEVDALEGEEPLFGSKVALDGTTAAVAAAGAVFVYEQQRNGAWSQVAQLTGDEIDIQFGSALAVQRDTILVGSYRPIVGDPAGLGQVYAYRRHFNGTWLRWKLLLPPDDVDSRRPSGPTEYFGFSVALDQRTAFVGIPGDDLLGPNAGAIQVFDVNRCGWDVAPHHCGRLNL